MVGIGAGAVMHIYSPLIPFFCFPLQARGAKDRRRPYTDPLVIGLTDGAGGVLRPGRPFRIAGGRRGLSANHDGYRAAIGQPPRHFVRIPRGAGGSLGRRKTRRRHGYHM